MNKIEDTMNQKFKKIIAGLDLTNLGVDEVIINE